MREREKMVTEQYPLNEIGNYLFPTSTKDWTI
jgi:hypothetical protein